MRSESSRSIARRITGEPLLHFVLLGAILYGLYAYVQAHSQSGRITISKDRSAQLAAQYRQQYGGSPSARQLDGLIEQSILEEIYFREALRLGLDKDDEIVRRRLIQKFEFLQQDRAIPREPTETELRGFFAAHPERYQLPERLTFTHAYFSPDKRSDTAARQAASELAAGLNRGGAIRAGDQGDRYPGPYDFAALSHDEIARVFGQDGLAKDIFSLPPRRWSPPLRSGFGWHTVYVLAHEPGRAQAFDEVREKVHQDYLEAERMQRNSEAVAKLRRQFEILRK